MRFIGKKNNLEKLVHASQVWQFFAEKLDCKIYQDHDHLLSIHILFT